MARRIIVVSGFNLAPTGERLKKSVAKLLVRRQVADWIIPNVSIYRRRICATNLAALPRVPRAARENNVPDRLPPVIVEGMVFVPPPMLKNPTLSRIVVDPLIAAAQGWDWTYEQPSA